MDTAIVEFDPLADPVRTAAQDDDLLAVGDLGLAFRLGQAVAFIAGVHIGRFAGEFCGAGVDALIDRAHVQIVAQGEDGAFLLAGQFRQSRVGEAHFLQPQQALTILWQAVGAHRLLGLHDVFDLRQEPAVDLVGLVDFFQRHALTEGLGDLQQPVRQRLGNRRAPGVPVLADFDLVQAGQPGFHGPQRLLQAFAEGPADGHGLADRFHRRGQGRVGAGELLEGEARHLGDDIVDRRLEAGRRHLGDVVVQLVQRIADGQLGRDLGDREAGRLRRQGGGARDARVHLDHDQAAIVRIDRELHVRSAGVDADLAQAVDRGVAHDLVFFVGQRQRRGDGDRIAGMHAHRVDILDGADDDAIVVLVADDLHLEFLPAKHRFLDQHRVDRRRGQAALHQFLEFVLVIGDAAAGAAHGEGRTDDRRQLDVIQRQHGLFQRPDLTRPRAFQADLVHRLAEPLAVFRLVDDVGVGADHLDIQQVQHAALFQLQRGVQRRLTAHGRQQHQLFVRMFLALALQDLGDHLGRDRLDIGRIRRFRVGHDRRRVRIHQHDAVAFLLQRLAGLRARIVEFAGLTDHDGAGPDDHDGVDICTFGHGRTRLRKCEALIRQCDPVG